MTSVLFVCLGNICRSPLAEGVFRHVVETAGLGASFAIDSAGTGAWHRGNPPDPRSIEVAARHGIDISGLRARQIDSEDFKRFNLILAMDRDNLTSLRRLGGPADTASLRMFLTAPDREVPDPYYGGPDGFDAVYRMVEAGSHALLQDLTRR